MAVYEGPQRDDIIDAPLLSRFFFNLDHLIDGKIKVYVLGGTALTLLGLRKEGSGDIDISCNDNSSVLNDALDIVRRNIRAGKIFIPITKGKKEVKAYPFPRDAIVQVFGTSLTEGKRLPEDFTRYAHKVKNIEWVIPEGGIIRSLRCDEVFGHIEIHTLGFADIFCSKVFGLRERDRNDITFMIKNKGLYFRWHKKFILHRFQQFWKANKGTSESIKRGAVQTYNAFQQSFPDHLLTLKL